MGNCFLVKLKDRGFLAWSIQLHTGYYVTDDIDKARKYSSIESIEEDLKEFEEGLEEKNQLPICDNFDERGRQAL